MQALVTAGFSLDLQNINVHRRYDRRSDGNVMNACLNKRLKQ